MVGLLADSWTVKTILSPAECDLRRLPLGALEAFVLSQFDGRSTLEEVAEIAGLELAAASGLAKRLVELGAVTISGAVKGSPKSHARSERPARHDPRTEKESLRPARHDPRAEKHSVRPARHDSRAAGHSLRPHARAEKETVHPDAAPASGRPRAEVRADPKVGRPASRKSLRMARVSGAPVATSPADEACDLDEATRARIAALEGKLKTHDHYALLEVDRSAERKAIKSAYFAFASKFHPDRFFGKKLGRARASLERVFHRLTEAHDVLTDGTRRAAYDATLPPPPKAPPPPRRKTSRKLAAVVAPPPATKRSTMPPTRAPTPRPPPAPRPIIPPPVTPAPVSDTTKKLAATVVDGSLRRVYAAAQRSEAQKRVAVFVRAAEEAMKVDDVIGAANNYRLALQNGDDPELRAKLEDVDDLAKKRRFELSMGRARSAERDRKWAEAAFEFSRAHDARPGPEAAERAAHALRMSEGDLQRAASLAELAVAKEPKNAGYRVTLGEIHLAANALERAAAEADGALALAPNDPRAKQLAAAVKKKREIGAAELGAAIATRADRFERLARLGLCGDGRALVVGLRSAAEAERDLHAPLLEVEIEGHQGVALAQDGALQVADLLGVQEQLARAALRVRERAGREEGCDVHLPQPHLARVPRRRRLR